MLDGPLRNFELGGVNLDFNQTDFGQFKLWGDSSKNTYNQIGFLQAEDSTVQTTCKQRSVRQHTAIQLVGMALRRRLNKDQSSEKGEEDPERKKKKNEMQ